MEKKTTIKVPDPYLPLLEDVRTLNSDQNNPNRMTNKQKDQVWQSLKKYGWTYPILSNKDGTLVDGEQRTEICTQHGEFFAPVLRLPVSDVDRRMLRQITVLDLKEPPVQNRCEQILSVVPPNAEM